MLSPKEQHALETAYNHFVRKSDLTYVDFFVLNVVYNMFQDIKQVHYAGGEPYVNIFAKDVLKRLPFGGFQERRLREMMSKYNELGLIIHSKYSKQLNMSLWKMGTLKDVYAMFVENCEKTLYTGPDPSQPEKCRPCTFEIKKVKLNLSH